MKDSYKILTAFAVGAAAGALLGILFAPEKGFETRAKLSLKSKKAVDEVKEMMDKGKEKFNHLKQGIPVSKKEPVDQFI